MSAATPLLKKQRELLNILNEERRKRHAEMRNKDAKGHEFSPGDIVIVKRRVQSDKKRAIAGKVLIQARGPYRVLGKVLGKMPFLWIFYGFLWFI